LLAVTVYVDMDKPEDHFFVTIFERFLHKQFNKPLQKIGLLPEPASPLVKLSRWRYLCGVPVVFAFTAPFAWLGIKVYIIYMAFEMLTWHQLYRHSHALFHIIFDKTLYFEFLIILYISFVPAFLWAAYLDCSLQAWNRRADRLNREPSLPLPAVADVPGVWPPPPTVSGDVS